MTAQVESIKAATLSRTTPALPKPESDEDEQRSDNSGDDISQ